MGEARLEDLVDTGRYPIAALCSAEARALVADGRRALAADAVFALPGFVRPRALSLMQKEARALVPAGHRRVGERDAVGRATPLPTRVALSCVGLDQMSAASSMRQLFMCDALTDFIGALLGVKPYYRSTDPLASCMVTALAPGDELGWHFDDNDGVVTLMLEHCAQGGLFEYVRNARDLDDTALERIVEAGAQNVTRMRHEPGTLTLFNGHRALHRVSPVLEGPARLTLIFSYDSRPNQVFGSHVRRGFFGREAPLDGDPELKS